MVQRHDTGQQGQSPSSGSTPHDHVSIQKIRSLCSPLLDRPWHSASTYPTIASNRATAHNARGNPPILHRSVHRPPISRFTSPAICRRTQRVQIPIGRAAPPHVPIPAVSSLGGFPTTAPCARLAPSWGRHPKTFTITDIALIISGSTPPLNEQDAVVIAVLCVVLQSILIAVQWPSRLFPVLACRALFLQIRRNRLLPQVERETCQSPHSSVLAGPPTSQ